MSVILNGVVAGPAVLLLARNAALHTVRPRTIDVIAVCALAGSLAGLVLALPAERAVVLLPLAVLGGAAAVVDAHEGRLPDILTWPLLAGTLLASGVTGQGHGVIGVALTGALVGVVMKAAVPAGFGWGDVKLVPTLAVVLAQHDAVATGIVSTSILVTVTAVLVSVRAPGRSTLVPYGPAMVLATVGAAAL